MTYLMEKLNALVWGAPALVMILGVGLYLSVQLRFVQLTLFPQAVKSFLAKLRPGADSSSFRSLCTALAATVGTGNLVGVAGAICLGGPGAIFWMWVCGILGMVTKYAEATLAVHYRVKTTEGFSGGPMYGMLLGMGPKGKPLAALYCIFGLIAAFGVGNGAQINAVVTAVNGVFSLFGWEESVWRNLLLGLALAVLIGRMLFGGAKRIGAVAEGLVPFAAGMYLLLCAGVLLVRLERIPQALWSILRGAFDPKAVTGGMLGSAFQALKAGCARGVFTNEAGMGTAAIAHAGAEVDHPAQQGLMGMMEVFLDTIVICTLTALVILVSDVPIPYGADAGGVLTTDAFCGVYGPAASVFLAVFLVLFAVATVLGWGLYGARCAEFLFGPKAWKVFALAQTLAVVFGAVGDTALVWQLAETVNGLMAIPNLIMLACLSPVLVRLTKEYKNPATGCRWR